MTISVLNCLTQLAAYLNVPIGKISLNVNSIPVRTLNNSSITGFMTIIFQLLKETNLSLNVTNIKSKAELRQWLEYALVYILPNETLQNNAQILNELNNVLSVKTYLVSSNLSLADIVLFYLLHNTMINLSYLEKEKYLNISRWFDNLQQDIALRQKNKIVDFSTNYLSGVEATKS